MNEELGARLVGSSAVAFGAAASAAPRQTARVFAMSDPDPAHLYLFRLAGLWSLALGINLLRARDPEHRRQLLVLAAATDGLSCAFTIRSGLPTRTAVISAVVSASVAATAAVSLLDRRRQIR
jgi:hypothetical protein